MKVPILLSTCYLFSRSVCAHVSHYQQQGGTTATQSASAAGQYQDTRVNMDSSKMTITCTYVSTKIPIPSPFLLFSPSLLSPPFPSPPFPSPPLLHSSAHLHGPKCGCSTGEAARDAISRNLPQFHLHIRNKHIPKMTMTLQPSPLRLIAGTVRESQCATLMSSD